MKNRIERYALIALCATQALLVTPAAVFGQGSAAGVTGEVRDSSGAAVPRAVIAIRNTETGVSRSTVTNDAGVYAVSGLQPGTYDIGAESPGFKHETQPGIVLAVAQEARLDFKLEVGASSEVVNVTAEAPVTETESSSTGTVIDNRKVVELPLNGRQFYSLALLIPGTTLPAENSTDGFRGGFNVSGRAETNNNFTVNGIDNNDMANGSPSVRPSVDDIEEFKLLTGVYSAEFGRSSGGQIVVVTKSGTNGLHGTMYEFLRNQKMDAVNYFTPAGSKPAFRRNNFGATVGGPIIRNKTFFHFSYEGLRLTQQVAALGTVPTAAMDAGDFSTLLSAVKPVIIKNPLSGAPFAGNIIPASLINPVGAAIMKQYAPATSPTLTGAPSNNFTLNSNQTEEMNPYSARVDHTFSGKDSLNSSYMMFRDPIYYVFNSLCGSSVMPNGGCYTGWTGQLFGISENHIFSAALVNEARVGVQRMVQPRVQTDNNVNFWGQFPYVTNVGPLVPNNNGVPSVTVTGYSKLGGPTNLPQARWDTTYDYRDTLNWQHGTHAFKFGGEFRPFDTNFQFVSNGRGALTFNDSASAPASGYAMADVILGYPTSTANNPLAPPIYGRTKGLYLFALDDWKVNAHFTLNIGLRWELNTPYSDAHNQIANFNQTTGLLQPAGVNGVPSAIFKTDYKKYDPRLGFAWQPFGNAKTVVRGGAGIFSDNLVTFNGITSVLLNPPFRAPANYASSVASPITLSNPFPLGSASGFPAIAGAVNDYVALSAYEWSLGVQRQLPFDTLLEVTYLGSKGSNLPLTLNINMPAPGPGTTAQVQARRPYPAYAGITEYESGANSRYHSLQLKLEKHYSKGLAILLSETYAKSIDNSPQSGSTSNSSKLLPQNSFNAAGEMGPSDFNVRSRMVLSVVAVTPFGKGKAWLAEGFAGKVLGNWQTTAILSLQTGRPFTPYFAANNSNTSEGSDRPNAVVGCDLYSGFQTVTRWVNPACFTTPAAGTFGNLGRNTITGPGLFNLDFALDRTFPLTERFKLQFRAETFNLFNHPNFNLPVTGFDSPSFGSLTSAFDPRQVQFGLKLVY